MLVSVFIKFPNNELHSSIDISEAELEDIKKTLELPDRYLFSIWEPYSKENDISTIYEIGILYGDPGIPNKIYCDNTVSMLHS